MSLLVCCVAVVSSYVFPHISVPNQLKATILFPHVCFIFIHRVLIATQHFLKSSALVESMYSGMSHHERYFILNEKTDSKCHYGPAELLTLHRN